MCWAEKKRVTKLRETKMGVTFTKTKSDCRFNEEWDERRIKNLETQKRRKKLQLLWRWLLLLLLSVAFHVSAHRSVCFISFHCGCSPYHWRSFIPHRLVSKVKYLRQKNSSFVFFLFDVVRLNCMHFSHQLKDRCQSPSNNPLRLWWLRANQKQRSSQRIIRQR